MSYLQITRMHYLSKGLLRKMQAFSPNFLVTTLTIKKSFRRFFKEALEKLQKLSV